VSEAALAWTGRRARRSALAGKLGVAAAAVAWLLWAINFNVLAVVDGDSSVQYTFVRRLFGEDVEALGYQFGLALLEAPFYAVGKLLRTAGLETVEGAPVEQAAVAFGGALYVLATVLLCARLLKALGLSFRGSALFFATFGTPLFFYGTFFPGKSHACDTFLLTLALVLLLAYLRAGPDDTRLVVALGLVFGLALTVRYFSAGGLAAVVAGLLVLRRPRHAALLAATGAATAGLLLLVPLGLGVPLTGGNYDTHVLGVDLLGPLKMLFTEHRGLFVWSPVALLGAIGYVRLLGRPGRERGFYALAGSMAVAILVSYAAVPFWDGTWSFSQRFLTPLFPLVAIGLCSLAAVRKRTMLVLASLATAWSVYLALTLQTVGPPNDNYDDLEGGAFDVAVQVVERDVNAGEYVWGLRHASRLVP
jgi:hypothetical protein